MLETRMGRLVERFTQDTDKFVIDDDDMDDDMDSDTATESNLSLM